MGGSNEGVDEQPTPPILWVQHACFKQTDCTGCHDTPARNHVGGGAPDCAACHGGNGACDPNGPFSTHIHGEFDDCATCHGERHGFVLAADCTACHFASAGIAAACDEPQPEPENFLQPAAALRSGCFGWPTADFTPENFAPGDISLREGQAAVDFTLETPAGQRVTLGDLLTDKPVVFVTGSLTCPPYRGVLPLLNGLAQESYDEGRTYADVVHFVHVYVIEAHPLAPDVSPYGGVVWEEVFSSVPQAYTYGERVQAAAEIQLLIEGDQILVVDALSPGDLVNPVWCTYGPAPNMAFLIGRDGRIELAQPWAEVPELKDAIDQLLAR